MDAQRALDIKENYRLNIVMQCGKIFGTEICDRLKQYTVVLTCWFFTYIWMFPFTREIVPCAIKNGHNFSTAFFVIAIRFTYFPISVLCLRRVDPFEYSLFKFIVIAYPCTLYISKKTLFWILSMLFGCQKFLSIPYNRMFLNYGIVLIDVMTFVLYSILPNLTLHLIGFAKA